MKGKLKTFFSRDRKTLYMILSIVLISIFSLTIVYAALSVTLNIQGNAEVVASTWDIHLDNVKVTSGSVSGTAPSITGGTTATFSTTLTTPGDFYQFTIDVVNNGTIDAMIDGITKTPTLTTAQAKYLNYIVEYENGESINTKHLVAKDSFVRLKVRVEYRKDITASDLPTTSETLNLAFTVNYIQSDGINSEVVDSGVCSHSTYENGYCTVCGQLQSYNVSLLSEVYGNDQGAEIVGNPVAYHGQDLVVEFKNTVSESQTSVYVGIVENSETWFDPGADGITFVDNILTIPGRFVTSDIVIDAYGMVAITINPNGGEITEEGIETIELFGGTWNPETSVATMQYGVYWNPKRSFSKNGYTMASVIVDGVEYTNKSILTDRDQIWDIQWITNSTS